MISNMRFKPCWRGWDPQMVDTFAGLPWARAGPQILGWAGGQGSTWQYLYWKTSIRAPVDQAWWTGICPLESWQWPRSSCPGGCCWTQSARRHLWNSQGKRLQNCHQNLLGTSSTRCPAWHRIPSQEVCTGTRKRSPFLLMRPSSALYWQSLPLCQLIRKKCASLTSRAVKGRFGAERQ